MAACLEINIAQNVKLFGIIRRHMAAGSWLLQMIISIKLKTYSKDKERSEFINMNEL